MDFSMFEDLPGVSKMIQNMNSITASAGQESKKHPTGAKPDTKPNTRPFPTHTPLAMAYVPYQQWNGTYNDEEGFVKGTVFPELDYPFMGEEERNDT